MIKTPWLSCRRYYWPWTSCIRNRFFTETWSLRIYYWIRVILKCLILGLLILDLLGNSKRMKSNTLNVALQDILHQKCWEVKVIQRRQTYLVWVLLCITYLQESFYFLGMMQMKYWRRIIEWALHSCKLK